MSAPWIPAAFRCFDERDWPEQGAWDLLQEEARHLQVRRVKPGSTLTLLNGKGAWAEARLLHLDKRSARVDILETRQQEQPFPQLSLCIGGLKASAWEEMLPHLVELGVNRIIRVETDHAVSLLKEGKLEAKRKRWREKCVQACKQCALAWLPELVIAESLDAVDLPPVDVELWASLQEDSRELRDVHSLLMDAKSLRIWVGPEGDFSEREQLWFRERHLPSVSMGPRILRAETAALSLAAWCRLSR